MDIKLFLAIGAGGFLGAVARFAISTFLQKSSATLFPVGTLGVNVLGSFAIGFLILYFENVISPIARAALITGLLGALTTFSTFSYETVSLFQSGAYQKALLNIFLNVTLSISATIGGMILFKKMYGGV